MREREPIGAVEAIAAFALLFACLAAIVYGFVVFRRPTTDLTVFLAGWCAAYGFEGVSVAVRGFVRGWRRAGRERAS